MQFGIFYEHQLPRPWQPDDEQRLIDDALEQVKGAADRLGIDYAWEVEHHFRKCGSGEGGGPRGERWWLARVNVR